MKIKKTLPSARLLFALASAVALNAQLPSSIPEVVRNCSRLAGSIELDRAVYFPDEEALLTISVRNPTSVALRVATPFLASSGSLGLLEQSSDGKWLSMDPHGSAENLLSEQTPSVVLNPGEERRISLKSTDSQFGAARRALLTGTTPGEPGLYQVYYELGGGRKNFRVVEPFFEVAGQATLRDDEVIVENGETIRLPRSIEVFAVRWDGLSYICASYPTTGSGTGYPDPGQRLGHNNVAGLVHKRVFTSTAPIAQLQVQEQTSGNFVIAYTDANTQTGLIRLSPTLQPL